MARQVHRLDPKDIEKHLSPGRYPDGAGLYLQVGPSGNKSWLLRFMRDGRAREMGLGPLHTVGLLDARKRAKKARLKLLDGVDPIAEREALKTADRLAKARSISFDECAAAYIKAHRKG